MIAGVESAVVVDSEVATARTAPSAAGTAAAMGSVLPNVKEDLGKRSITLFIIIVAKTSSAAQKIPSYAVISPPLLTSIRSNLL